MTNELYTGPLFSDANLVAYYRMEGNGNDSKGSNNFTNNGMVFNPGKFGYCADKAGTTTRQMRVMNALGTTSAGNKTVSLWVKLNVEFTGADKNDRFFVLGWSDNKSTIFAGYDRISGVNYIRIGGDLNGTLSYNFLYPISLGTTNWHHICVTASGKYVQGFIDGQYVGNVTIAAGSGESAIADQLTLFDWNDLIDAAVDDVAVFSRVLTNTEIANLYAERFKTIQGITSDKIKLFQGLSITGNELYGNSLFSDANLVAYYRMEGNSNDSKGTYNGTDTAISYGTNYGKFGQGASFNGTTSKVVASNSLSLTATKISISCWVLFTGLSQNLRIFDIGDSSYTFQLLFDNDGSRLICTKSSKYQSASTATQWFSPSVNNWYHLVAVLDNTGNTTKLYVNGAALSGAANNNVGTGPASANLYIGVRRDSVAGTFMTGYIDDFSVFNRELSPSEVSSLYQGQIKTIQGLS